MQTVYNSEIISILAIFLNIIKITIIDIGLYIAYKSFGIFTLVINKSTDTRVQLQNILFKILMANIIININYIKSSIEGT